MTGNWALITAKDCDKPKKRLESIAPTGFHLPKIMAAIAINPCPAIVEPEKLTEIDWANIAPPIPPNKPEINTPEYLIR